MNIYLDIDGVLVTNNEAAQYANEFLRYVITNYPDSTFWLTTRCQGNAETTVNQISKYFDDDVAVSLKAIKPTVWNVAKTEAIDFTKPFLWFDDTLLYGEREVLTAHHAFNKHILINLRKNPKQLKFLIDSFPQSA